MGFFKLTWKEVLTTILFTAVIVEIGVYLLITPKSRPLSPSRPIPSLQQLKVTQPSSTSLPTNSGQTGPTANWKTYTNKKYNYSIKYPKEYAPYEFGSSGPTGSNENATYVIFRDAPLPSVWNDQLPNALTLQVMDSEEFNREKKKLDQAASRAPCAGCPLKYSTLISGTATQVYDGYGGYTVDKILLLEQGGKFYELSYPYGYGYDPSISDLMINTFRSF